MRVEEQRKAVKNTMAILANPSFLLKIRKL